MGKGSGNCSERNALLLTDSSDQSQEEIIEDERTTMDSSTQWRKNDHRNLLKSLTRLSKSLFDDEASQKVFYKVCRIVADEQRRTAFYWRPEEEDFDMGFNVFLQASSTDAVLANKLSRSITSKKGFELERISKRLAQDRYGEDNVPSVVHSPSLVAQKEVVSKETGCIILSDFRKGLVESETQRLVQFAKNNKKEGGAIGTKWFEDELNKSIKRIKGASREEQAWEVELDLVFKDKDVFSFVEIKSGGDLDTSNAYSQTAKIIRAQLAYGEENQRAIFACAYANNGEGKSIKGNLNAFFETKEPRNPSLCAGSQWWNQILPKSVDYGHFIAAYKRTGQDYRIEF